VADGADWIPPGIDTTKASAARVYDWWLGGQHNFKVDEDAARAYLSVQRNTRVSARAYRNFLIRAVRYLTAEAGIRQFLDIGSGIPTEQNVHQVAQAIAPGSRVVYVDNDDVAVAHSKAILAGNPGAAAILADLRDPEVILGHPETRRLLDFSQPVGLILAAVLHFVPDSDNPGRIIQTLREPLAPGSYLAISHGCTDTIADMADAYASTYNKRVAATAAGRTREEIARLFDGFTLIEPGLVWCDEWRPDSPSDVPEDPSSLWAVGGVGKYTPA
jgi:hypothetical protein